MGIPSSVFVFESSASSVPAMQPAAVPCGGDGPPQAVPVVQATEAAPPEMPADSDDEGQEPQRTRVKTAHFVQQPDGGWRQSFRYETITAVPVKLSVHFKNAAASAATAASAVAVKTGLRPHEEPLLGSDGTRPAASARRKLAAALAAALLLLTIVLACSSPSPDAAPAPAAAMHLSYGYGVDANEPYFIAKKMQLFELAQADVDIITETSMDSDTKWSTSDDTISEKVAAEMHVSGSYGAFSAGATAQSNHDSSSQTKTSRLDAFVLVSKAKVTAAPDLRLNPHTKLNPHVRQRIEEIDDGDVAQLAEDLGVFFAVSANLGGVVQKTYSMRMRRGDDERTLKGEVHASYGPSLIGGGVSGSRERQSGHSSREIKASMHAEGGDTTMWLGSNAHPELSETNVQLDDSAVAEIQSRWAETFEDDLSNSYPFGMELKPIWELVTAVDERKGLLLQRHLERQWSVAADVERCRACAYEPEPAQGPTPAQLLQQRCERQQRCGAHGSAAVTSDGACTCHCRDSFIGPSCEWAPQYVVRGARDDKYNGAYARMETGERCNRKPVYRLPSPWGGLGKTRVLFQPSGKSYWMMGDKDRAVDCDNNGHISSNYGRCEGSPDGDGCDGEWREYSSGSWSQVTGLTVSARGW
eukprot:COSAG04_NODE_1159_length_8037_cov_3.743890_2_plen_642_part_00